METHDPDARARERAQRLAALTRDLIPAIRQLNPTLSEMEVEEAARRVAAYRLDDEEGIWLGG